MLRHAECHCKAGHVDKSKLGRKSYSAMDSGEASPLSGSEAGWGPENKESKHKARLAKLFHRRPKSHGSSHDASSVADSQATESSRYEVGFPCLQHIAVTLSNSKTAEPVPFACVTQG